MNDDSTAFDADAAFESARLLHEAGQLEQARLAYQQILSLEPQHADALHLLGVIAHQSGEHERAIKLIQKAIDAKPGQAIYFNNQGSALRAQGRLQDALIAYQVSLHINPQYAPAQFNLGVALSDLEQWELALQRFRQAAELDPGFADAHYNQAIAERRLGRPEQALASFRAVLRLQPANGLALHYVALLSGATSERAPDAYVASVFDGSAEHFDQHLLQELHYDTPQRLVDLLVQCASPAAKQWQVLDIGCGTGLVGAAIASHASGLVGVDLSPKMLGKARQRDLYQRLEQSELLAMMEREAGATYDVVTSADVFIYIGKLDAVFEQARRLLKQGGYFAFSAEALEALPEANASSDAGEDYRLTASGRYVHAAAYLRTLAAGHGFQLQTMLSAAARLENRQPVQAWLVLCRAV
ncbi:MAG: tetratricopeptide repeat protein [Pseudomonadota bacterium]